MTLIRDIASDEVPLLLDGARAFFAEAKLLGTLNPESFVRGWQGLLRVGAGLLLGAFDKGALQGAIGGTIYPDFPTGDIVVMESFWFTIPGRRGAGLKLLREFEAEAKARGAKRILMIHLAELNDASLSRLYERLDYQLKEKIYIKSL